MIKASLHEIGDDTEFLSENAWNYMGHKRGKPLKLKFPKPKKFNKTRAKRHLDKLFSLKVREHRICALWNVDGIKCSSVLQCAHVIGRANLYLRWNKLNALCICSGHHVYYTYHPEAWRELMQRWYGIEYQILLDERNKKITFNEVFYKEKLKELE